MTMKLGKDIIWIETFTNWQIDIKILETLSSGLFYDIQAKKVNWFLRSFAEYLVNDSTDFHHTYVILGNCL